MPIVLTRFIASVRHTPDPSFYYIDGTGAPGMSGAPVFIERQDGIRLFGVYTGLRYTRNMTHRSSDADQLGLVADITAVLWEQKKLSNPPREIIGDPDVST